MFVKCYLFDKKNDFRGIFRKIDLELGSHFEGRRDSESEGVSLENEALKQAKKSTSEADWKH